MADLNRVILGPGVMCWWLVAVSNLAALAARRKRSRQNYRTNFSSDVIKRRPQDASGRMRTLLWYHCWGQDEPNFQSVSVSRTDRVRESEFRTL